MLSIFYVIKIGKRKTILQIVIRERALSIRSGDLY